MTYQLYRWCTPFDPRLMSILKSQPLLLCMNSSPAHNKTDSIAVLVSAGRLQRIRSSMTARAKVAL